MSVSSMDVQFDLSGKSSSILSQDKPKVKFTRLKRTYKKKVKLKPPSALERIFGNKNIVRDHYFTAGNKITNENQRDILQEPSPFTYPKDLEEFSYKVMSKGWREILRKKELKYKFNERNNYRSRQQLDVLNRLYAKEPDVSKMVTVVDMDPAYFTLVEGRPAKKQLKIRKYVSDNRAILRTKVVAGYKEDDIMLMDENIANEQKLIDEIRKEYQHYVDIFEEFLFDDHTTSMNMLRQSEQQAEIAAQKYDIYRDLSKNYGALKASLYNLEEKWRNSKMYQKFLYLVSPMEWRKKNDYYLHKTVSNASTNEPHEESSELFSRYRLASTGDVMSLEGLIDQFLEDVKYQETPRLFFTEPWQLLKAFRFIEIQNSNSLMHSEELALPLEHVNVGMMRARDMFNIEINVLQEMIDNLEGGILWEEKRAAALKQLALELINSEFKKVIADSEVLNLYVFVEDAFETRVSSNDAKLNMSEMMTAIEVKYLNYLLRLDMLPQELVYKAESECYAEEARIMKIAKRAAKKVVQIERLTRKLNKALEPPFVRTVKKLKWRSPPLNPPLPRPPPPRPLTSGETEFLTFFTEYCQQYDDVEDFGIRVSSQDVEKTSAEKDEEKSECE